MSGLIRWNGILLRRAAFGGRIARSLACCCVSGCCGCKWLEAYHKRGFDFPCNGRIKVTVSGGIISGFALLGPTSSAEHCLIWDSQSLETCGDITTIVNNECGCSIVTMKLMCLNGKTLVTEMELAIAGTTTRCLFTNMQQTSHSCGPPLAITYTCTVTGDDIDCLFGPTTLTFTVINYDPWP